MPPLLLTEPYKIHRLYVSAVTIWAKALPAHFDNALAVIGQWRPVSIEPSVTPAGNQLRAVCLALELLANGVLFEVVIAVVHVTLLILIGCCRHLSSDVSVIWCSVRGRGLSPRYLTVEEVRRLAVDPPEEQLIIGWSVLAVVL